MSDTKKRSGSLDPVAPDSSAIERYEAEQPNAISIRSIDDIKRMSLIFVQSGMFKGDTRLSEQTKMYQAGVKIIAGVEFGIQPFAAMRGINIINGNAEMSANLMAAKVKKHPKYDYRVTKWDQDGCAIDFYELPHPNAPRKEWDKLGESSFSADDAIAAGLSTGKNADTWRKFARNMYFARAISNGVRIYTPDVFYGAPVYVEGEISGEFGDTPQEADKAPAQEAELVDASTPTPEVTTNGVTREQLGVMKAGFEDLNINEQSDMLNYVGTVIARLVASATELTEDEANRVISKMASDVELLAGDAPDYGASA
jgi:hypothetical protein